mmetsp:Transcript_16928/g.36735  ORF Transcript_16928/g.36735 Transcript_16928/m.36735 type:complete len:201 (+) Transcript_16928:92-694(+)
MVRRRESGCHPLQCLRLNWTIWLTTKRRNVREWRFSNVILESSSSLRVTCPAVATWEDCTMLSMREERRRAKRMQQWTEKESVPSPAVPPSDDPSVFATPSSTTNPLPSHFVWDVIFPKILVPKRRRSETSVKSACEPPQRKLLWLPNRECRTKLPWLPRRILRMGRRMLTTIWQRRRPRRSCGRVKWLNGVMLTRRCLT